MTSESAAAGSETSAAPSARSLLVEWANRQDGWVRIVVGEVLTTRSPVPEDALTLAFKHFLAEKGLEGETPDPVDKLALEGEEAVDGARLVLGKLSEVEGVNALAGGQEIDFNAGLTILYGENASGKTGYARVLKQLAAVRTAEVVLPNVHESGTPKPQSAKLEYEVGSERKKLEWKGERGISPFTQLCIFDTPAVSLHVDDELTYVFTPGDLELFQHVADGLERVRKLACDEADRRKPGANAFVQHFERESAIYPVVETLGPATDMANLEKLAEVSDDSDEQLKLLRDRVSSLRATSVDAEVSVARARRDFYGQIAAVTAIAEQFDAETYNASVAAAEQAETDLLNLRAELVAAVGVEEDAKEVWESFIVDGDQLGRHLEGHDYPKEGDPCIYCRQSLGAKEVELLGRYRNFATDASRKRIEDARKTASTLAGGLKGIDVARLQAELARRKEDDGADAVAGAELLIGELTARREQWEEPQKLDWEAVVEAARGIGSDAGDRRDAAATAIEELTAKSEERQESLALASGQLRELEAKVQLKSRLPEMKTHVADARWAQLVEQLVRKWQGLQKSLTDTTKVASEKLLNADFEKRFGEESKALRAPKVRLAFPGHKGRPARRKVVSGVHLPSAILSEGEQKVIALADFLAEASIRATPAPVVFDDPVSSLDHRRIDEVAARIEELAEGRQVILFTHSIWLTTNLLARFEKKTESCSYFDVSDEAVPGTISKGTHPRWDSPNQLKKRINSLIESAEASHGVERESIIENVYSHIRSWCEVVVEQDLLLGVTRRYEPHVRMTALPNIKYEKLRAATDIIWPIFEKACRVTEAHSQPLETLSVKRPGLDEVKADWQSLQDAVKEYKDA